ncbi:sister chromatid cohesion protein DCC1-like [Teleopsis dalmanni]|uniref:sister chromatid cohesion protein DCC1-like n=1 Tax=Teleopsis dalmanni TaxID=139649 RepID=UPI0018CD3793|nr:sister chromatid cohesion protein DCC1-like [Teleopsis dalmanni]
MDESDIKVEENDTGLYVRTLEDVKLITKHAKLDERSLTQVTQALYYPSADILADNIKLLELDEHLLQEIRLGHKLKFKGGLNEDVVLCTEEKTYDIKGAEISNSLLLVPDLKFAAATSTCPLKSPRTRNVSLERSLNSSTEDEPTIERVLEQHKILRIFHEYLECREIHPRFRKMGELLQLTRFSGPENEEYIEQKLLFSYEQLLDTIQCSEKQFTEGLRIYRVVEYNGYMRVLECDYEFRIVNLMVNLIEENSWSLDEIERDETIEALNGIAPRQIVEGLFNLYTTPTTDKPGKYTYIEELVARIVAQNILRPGLKFRLEEFLSAWQEALPDGIKCDKKYLRALGIICREGVTTSVRSLVEEILPTNIHDRLKILFKTKTKWTLDEIEPYMEFFTTPTLTVTTLLAKYARSLMEKGIRHYVSKH